MKRGSAYYQYYSSPLGDIVLTSDEEGLNGLWFRDEKSPRFINPECLELNETSVILSAKRWLDLYFTGKDPGEFTELASLHMIGTDFQMIVWNHLLHIPYGTSVTYQQIAQKAAKDRGQLRMSAQAVGGAVGRNPISIIVPCHRVIGSRGALVGYGGGLDRKEYLLNLEGITYQKPATKVN